MIKLAISYDEEISSLGSFQQTSGIDWWNPMVGSHRVKIVEEGQEYTTTYKGRDIPKVRFTIQVGGNTYNWGVNRGKTISSLWGQLVVCGKEWGGLAGKEISLIVKMTPRADGSNVREYTVLESVDIQAKKAQQPQSGNGIKVRLAAIRGQVFDKPTMLARLGISDIEFANLLDLGLIEQRGPSQFAVR